MTIVEEDVSTAYARLPLNALRVFEAVASRLSFADAAEDGSPNLSLLA